jgi:hypothetical protein
MVNIFSENDEPYISSTVTLNIDESYYQVSLTKLAFLALRLTNAGT